METGNIGQLQVRSAVLERGDVALGYLGWEFDYVPFWFSRHELYRMTFVKPVSAVPAV